jgi:hypothetical protein
MSIGNAVIQRWNSSTEASILRQKAGGDQMPDNQTNDDWLELPTVANNPNAKGTGVYLIQAGGHKDYARDITYTAMLSRDAKEKFFAFAWVPHAVATLQQIQQPPCTGRCSKTCKRPGCLCDRSIGLCK